MGLVFSFFIEASQLVLHRGLFEWDDMIHNSLGAMIGSIIANKIFEKFVKNYWLLMKYYKKEKIQLVQWELMINGLE